MKTLFTVGLLTLSLAFGNAGYAKEKQLNNAAYKKTKVEDLSHRSKYRYARVKGLARRGTMSQRFEIRHGDCGGNRHYDDCTNDRGRVELKENPKNAMSKPGKGVWYGFSVYIPKDFVSLGRANTILSQAKVEKYSTPLWALTFNDRPYLLYSDGSHCGIGSLSSWKGRWNDVVIFAHYGTSGQAVYFQLYKDDRLVCQRKAPIMPKSYAGKSQKIGLKYGIYSSFVSRYLAAKGKTPPEVKAYAQSHSSGQKSKSPSPTPFKYDWGVKLPTHVIYYDEFRYGDRREDVDVRLLEARGVPPLD